MKGKTQSGKKLVLWGTEWGMHFKAWSLLWWFPKKPQNLSRIYVKLSVLKELYPGIKLKIVVPIS